jgi:hypothetical protein
VIFSILVGIPGDFGHFGAKMAVFLRFWWLECEYSGVDLMRFWVLAPEVFGC